MKSFLKKFFDIKFWKFILVGLINTAVGYGVGLICLNIFNTSIEFSGFANTLVGSIVSYFLNRNFTFRNKEKPWKTILPFAINIAACYVLSYVVFAPWIARPLIRTAFPGWSVKLQENIAMLGGACFYVACNYIGQRFIVFREKTGNGEEKDAGTAE